MCVRPQAAPSVGELSVPRSIVVRGSRVLRPIEPNRTPVSEKNIFGHNIPCSVRHSLAVVKKVCGRKKPVVSTSEVSMCIFLMLPQQKPSRVVRRKTPFSNVQPSGEGAQELCYPWGTRASTRPIVPLSLRTPLFSAVPR